MLSVSGMTKSAVVPDPALHEYLFVVPTGGVSLVPKSDAALPLVLPPLTDAATGLPSFPLLPEALVEVSRSGRSSSTSGRVKTFKVTEESSDPATGEVVVKSLARVFRP